MPDRGPLEANVGAGVEAGARRAWAAAAAAMAVVEAVVELLYEGPFMLFVRSNLISWFTVTINFNLAYACCLGVVKLLTKWMTLLMLKCSIMGKTKSRDSIYSFKKSYILLTRSYFSSFWYSWYSCFDILGVSSKLSSDS
jgi:hypothetical protein